MNQVELEQELMYLFKQIWQMFTKTAAASTQL